MGQKFLADTTFIIDLLREHRRGKLGPASHALALSPESHIFLSIISIGELEEGFAAHGFTNSEILLKPFQLLYLSQRSAKIYGEESARMRAKGDRIGDNDLWIASSAKEHELSVLTANVQHFSRVSGLDVVDYTNVPSRS